MTDIFLSYASEDRSRIIPLVQYLENEGWTIWWDKELIAGPDYIDKIQENLDAAQCVLIVWSHNSVKSNWCRDEANEGLQRGRLVPILIDDVRPPLGFRTAHTASLIGWPQEASEIGGMLEGIHGCLKTSSTSTVSHLTGAGDLRSIAVLPFTNMSASSEQDYFCDGLVEDITSELSHIPQFLVISRNASFAYDGSSTDISEIAARLGVDFVLRGSVRRHDNRVRVSSTLVAAATGKTIWSKRYDRDLIDIFKVQDDLTNEIVTALDVELVSGERGRQRRRKYSSLEAGELLYKGLHEHYKFDHSAHLLAVKYFEEFVRLEPDSVLGYVWLVQSFTFAFIVGWEGPETALPKLRDAVDRCLAIDPDDPDALVGDTYYRAVTGDLDGAFESIERSIKVSPNLDEAWFARGWVQTLLGHPDQAIESIEYAMRLCPILNRIKLGVLATAYRNVERYEDAIKASNECLRRYPDFVYAHAGLAVIYSMQGDIAAAKREVDAVLSVVPEYSIQQFISPNFYRDKTTMERCAQALRKVGMPEG